MGLVSRNTKRSLGLTVLPEQPSKAGLEVQLRAYPGFFELWGACFHRARFFFGWVRNSVLSLAADSGTPSSTLRERLAF